MAKKLPEKAGWSWVHKKYPRKVQVLLEFENETDFYDIDALKGVALGEAIINILREDYSMADSFTLKVPESSRTVRITRVSKRTGNPYRGQG